MPEAEIKRLWEMSRRGVGDLQLSRQTGYSLRRIENALALVAPDGRVMSSRFGDRANDPTYTSPVSIRRIAADELPEPQIRNKQAPD